MSFTPASLIRVERLRYGARDEITLYLASFGHFVSILAYKSTSSRILTARTPRHHNDDRNEVSAGPTLIPPKIKGVSV